MKKRSVVVLSLLFIILVGCPVSCFILSIDSPTREEYEQAILEAREWFPKIREDLETLIPILRPAKQAFYSLSFEKREEMGGGDTKKSIKKWRDAYGDEVGDALLRVLEMNVRIIFYGSECDQIRVDVYQKGRQRISCYYAPDITVYDDDFLARFEKLDEN